MGISEPAVERPTPQQHLGRLTKAGDSVKKNKTLLIVLAVGVACNLALFFTKLYIGLSVNSVCIWSDAVNNLADSLSCALSLSFLAVTARVSRDRLPFVADKAQQLLSFVLAIVVLIVGFSFAYSSLERFMYPTPIWFQMKYFYVLLATALAKLAMFFFYRAFAKKTRSSVLRVMQQDSVLDFFITLTTLISFVLTQYVDFAVDAVFGLLISALICFNAARMIRSAVTALLNIVPRAKRRQVLSLLRESGLFPGETEVRWDVDEENAVTATAALSQTAEGAALDREALESLAEQCLEQTGIKLCFVLYV